MASSEREPDREPDTVTEAVALLQAEGYTADMNHDGAFLQCRACGATHELGAGAIERIYRFEGPSDPGDEAIVLGVRCLTCGMRGVLVSAFGPDAEPDAFAHLRRIAAGWSPDNHDETGGSSTAS